MKSEAAQMILEGTELEIQYARDTMPRGCENGIKTDQYCRTSTPNILAVGDCTSSFNTLFNKEFRLESVPNALAQSKVASSSIIGNELFNNEMPWFWSDQFNEPMDAIVYGVLVSLGFATFENITYVYQGNFEVDSFSLAIMSNLLR